MMDTASILAVIIGASTIGAFALAALLYWICSIFHGVVRPRLVSRAEIERLADDLMEEWPNPEDELYKRSFEARVRRDGFDLMVWERVAEEVKLRRSHGQGPQLRTSSARSRYQGNYPAY
jgi:hypothetical protein